MTCISWSSFSGDDSCSSASSRKSLLFLSCILSILIRTYATVRYNTYSREQGTGNREQGTGNNEQLSSN
ncbi:hypothetical protein SD80_006640 [Scytonema tolypothrichoides VB-61278]|nr:hypothetical protein SD80_006640 [Scytonema tolypothrichoides VB-61278]